MGDTQSYAITAHPLPTSPSLGEESIQFPPWNLVVTLGYAIHFRPGLVYNRF